MTSVKLASIIDGQQIRTEW